MSTETEVKQVKILVTGGAGFIGSHLMHSLLTEEYDLYCVGIDNFNNYYDVKLKKARHQKLIDKARKFNCNFIMLKKDISNKLEIKDIFKIEDT